MSSYLFFSLFHKQGEIVLFPSLQTIKASIIPDSKRARYLSVFDVFSAIGGLCASFFMLLLHVLSSTGFTILYGIIGLISIVILYRLKVIRSSYQLQNAKL